MSLFLNPESLTCLGWCLMNSIWQMGILWLAYLLLKATNPRFSPIARHNLALFFSGCGLSWFFSGLTGSGPGWQEMLWFPVSRLSFPAFVSFFISVITLIYLLILFIWAIRYMKGFFQLQKSKRYSAVRFSGSLQLFADRISAAMGIRKPVNILLVHWTDTAQTIGFFKPLVLLPVALVNRLTMEQTETILLHELLHIRRYDYLINIFMTIFRALFFFNPFARFFFKIVAQEREHACDDGVLKWDYPAPVYAEALFTLEKFRQLPNRFSLAADGNNPRLLVERIRRVMGEPVSGKTPFSPLLFLSLIAALFMFTVNSFARFSKSDSGQQYHAQAVATKNTYADLVSTKTAQTAIVGTIRLKVKHKSVSTRKVIRIQASDHAAVAKASVSLSTGIVPAVILQGEGANQSVDPENKNGLHYAGHDEVRNYSNEKAAMPEPPVELDLKGMPYVPSASFAYSSATDTLQPDVLLQNKLKVLLVMGKIKTAEMQARLSGQIKRNRKELSLMKIQSLKLSRQKQKDNQQVLQKIKEDMHQKNEEIRQLELQIQGGEIINI